MMKKFYLLLFLSQFIFSLGIAQPAADFTSATSEGNTISLYDTYLNQGKAVLIKFFFTSCPPCAQYAPHMEPMYQSWGAGDSVEFILITNQGFDDDARVNNYRTNNGYTFPAISSDGNALDIFNTYRNGPWGTAFGTPIFIVIAPNGDVNYNIRGGSVQATLDSINQAISDAFNGGPMPGDTMNTDTMNTDTMPTDTMQTDTMNPDTMQMDSIPTINKDRVFFSPAGDSTWLIYNLSDGTEERFLVEGSSTDFYLDQISSNDSFSMDAEIAYNISPLNGITTWDILLINFYVLGVDTPDALDFIRADVNNDGRISGLDMVDIRKMILGITDALPNDRKPFEYYPSFVEQWSAIFNIPQNWSFPTHFNYLDTTNDTIAFIGIRIGDVNRSFNLAEKKVESRTDGIRVLYQTKDEHTHQLLSPENISDLYNYQLDIHIDRNAFESLIAPHFSEYELFYRFIDDHTLRVLYYNVKGKNIGANDVILEINTKYDSPIKYNFVEWNENWEEVEIELTGNNMPLEIYPNPSTNVIRFNSDTEDILQLINADGKVILSNPIHVGMNTIELPHLPSGYYLAVKQKSKSASPIIIK